MTRDPCRQIDGFRVGVRHSEEQSEGRAAFLVSQPQRLKDCRKERLQTPMYIASNVID
jgi:hypothetical protein